jgi:hypothetical protein
MGDNEKEYFSGLRCESGCHSAAVDPQKGLALATSSAGHRQAPAYLIAA